MKSDKLAPGQSPNETFADAHKTPHGATSATAQWWLPLTTRVLFLAALASVAAGCTTTITVPRSELLHLNGYDARKEFDVPVTSMHPTPHGTHTVQDNVVQSNYRMIGDGGDPVTITSKTTLYLFTTGGEKVGGKFRSIQVDGDRFRGAALDSDDEPVDLSMDSILYGEISRYSKVKSTLLLSAAVAVLSVAVPLFLLRGGL